MKIALLLILLPSLVFTHSEVLDSNGGHNNSKNGGYHCHRQPCYDNQNTSMKATEEAIKKERPFSYIYNREDWKQWSDFDNDCMNTRHEILADQADGQIKLSPDGCYVSTGLWNDPFSGKQFTRASDLDVDHVVPLKWANDRGGHSWTKGLKNGLLTTLLTSSPLTTGLIKQRALKALINGCRQTKPLYVNIYPSGIE
jgi:hypothetical protein